MYTHNKDRSDKYPSVIKSYSNYPTHALNALEISNIRQVRLEHRETKKGFL